MYMPSRGLQTPVSSLGYTASNTVGTYQLVMPHDGINHQRKSCESTTSQGRRLWPLLGLQCRTCDTTRGDGIPYIVFSSKLFYQTFTTTKDTGYEGKISTPVQGLFSRCTKGDSDLLPHGCLRNIFSGNNLNGRCRIRHGTQKDTHQETHHPTTKDTQGCLSSTRVGHP